MSSRLRFLAVLTVLLATAGILLRDVRGPGREPDADSPLAQDYDYFISGMRLHRFTPEGNLQYRLASARVTHYPDPDHSSLESPLLHWYEPGQPDWVLSAHSGDLRRVVPGGEARLLLQQDVVASRAGTVSATLELRSESLVVLPDAGQLSTTDEIRVQDRGTRLNSAGMQAWLRENRIKLSAGSGQHE